MSTEIISKIRNFHLLPEHIQNRIISLLQHNDFSAAKEVYELWFVNNPSTPIKKDSPCEK